MRMRSPPEDRLGSARLTRVWESSGPLETGLAMLLLPAEAVYRLVSGIRNRMYDRGWARSRRALVPVVSVGNLAVGGTGKTPFSAWVASRLTEAGARPAILHGGYADDEPALHRRWNPAVPVLAERDRLAAAGRAAEAGATVAILDDGFQHRRLHRDLDIVLIAAETWEGRGALIPRGPWREPPRALRRADVVVVTRKSADGETAARVLGAARAHAPHAVACVAVMEPVAWEVVGAADGAPAGPCVAVAGVGAPDSFLANARSAGAQVARALIYGDHHRYTESDVRHIVEVAAGRAIVTTEKDALKLEVRLGDLPFWVLRQGIRIETGEAGLIRRLLGILQ